jgi:hypothetical protein
MAVALKRPFSQATTGIGIVVSETATPGQLIHTAPAGTTEGSFDEVWIWAMNLHTADVLLTIEYGAAHATGGNIVVTIPFKSGLVPVVPGLLLQNSLDINAFAATDDAITLYGFINRITDT